MVPYGISNCNLSKT